MDYNFNCPYYLFLLSLILNSLLVDGVRARNSRNSFTFTNDIKHPNFTTITYMTERIYVPLPTSTRSIFWLHIEKCGTSFGMVLFLHACPIVLDKIPTISSSTIWEGRENHYSAPALMERDECKVPLVIGVNQDFGWHMPYHNEIRGMNGSVFALFRHPIKRIISAYLFDRAGMIPPGFARDRKSNLPYRWNRGYEIETFKKYVLGSEYPIYTYADALFIRSAQTKMILGFSSAFNITITEAELVEAKRRLVYDFAFIGLQEEYTASLELFHRQFGTNHPKAPQVERIHIRKNEKNTKHAQKQLEKTLKMLNYRDRNDEEIYDLAAKIFYSRCEYFNITVTRKIKMKNL